jgi:hypothetical protein
MHSYPTHSISRNQPAVASTGYRWTAILSINFSTLPPHNCETRHGSIVTSTNTQLKERRFLHGLKATVSAPNI